MLLHPDRDVLKACLTHLRTYVARELHLEFNEKTEVFPIRNGVDYLGWHFYLTETGKVVKKVSNRTKKRYKEKLAGIQYAYASGGCSLEDIKQVLASYRAHLRYGNTYKLQDKVLSEFVLKKDIRKVCVV